MDIFIIATQGCSHCTNLKQELSDLGIDCEVKFAEENPELVEQYQIRHSPNLIVNGDSDGIGGSFFNGSTSTSATIN